MRESMRSQEAIQRHVCSCCVGFVALVWAWHRGPVLQLWGPRVWWEVSGVTFDPHQVLPWAWYGVKSEAMAVNEAEHHWCGAEFMARGKATKVWGGCDSSLVATP